MHTHKWNTNPPTKGKSWCIKCKDVYRGRGRPAQVDVPDFDVDSLIDVASEMSGVVREEAPEIASEKRFDSPAETTTLVPSPPPPPTPPAWTKFAAPKLTKLFLLLADQAGKWLKPPRKAKEPEKVSVDEFSDALAEQLTVWMPNAELSPAKKMILAGGSIVASMYIGAPKLEQEQTVNVQVADSGTKPEQPQQAKVIQMTTKTKIPNGLLGNAF